MPGFELIDNEEKNALINIGKEQVITVRDGGAPTTSSFTKGPAYEYTMTQFCEPIQISKQKKSLFLI